MVMVTMEDRVTRLEAAQEFNAQQSAEILSRLNLIVSMVEESRKEAREANEIARREAREMVEAARRDTRTFFIAGITVVGGVGGGVIFLMLRMLERLSA